MSINILRDYKDMIEDKYIDNKGIFTIEINKLQKKLKKSTSIDDVLTCMDALQIYKKVVEMKVCFVEMKQPKNPDVIYINARTAIRRGKHDRIWINYYIGKKEDCTESVINNAKIELAKKAIKTVLK